MRRFFQKLFGGQMSSSALERILGDVKSGSVSVEDAAEQVRDLVFRPFISLLDPRFFRWMGGLFLMIGIAFAIQSVYFSFGTIETDGIVTEMVGGHSQAPVVTYFVEGKLVKLQSRISSEFPVYAVGNKVKVLYDPKDPTSAQINSFIDRWLAPTSLTLCGLCGITASFALPGLLKLLEKRREG